MTFYINADTGDNGNDGSSSSPWETLAYAHGQASADDTIICQNSTATFSFATITFVKNLTIKGESDDASGAVFDGAGESRRWSWTTYTCTIEKITFQNVDGRYTSILGVVGTGTTLTIRNCVFKDLLAYTDSTGRGVIGASSYGDYISITIENCLFYDIVARTSGGNYAILTARGWDVNSSYTITGCTFHFKDTDYTNAGLFRLESSSAISVTIKNCIVSNETGGTIHFDNNDTTPNQVFDITHSDFFNISNLPTTGTGTITTDPLLVDSNNANFKLRQTSPCLDTGIII